MESSTGRAIAAPTPRRNVRRGKVLLVIIMTRKPSSILVAGPQPPLHAARLRGPIAPRRSPHCEWCAFHNGDNQRRHPIVVECRLPRDRAHGGIVVILNAATQRIGHQLLGYGPNKIFTVLRHHQLRETGGPAELATIRKLAARVDTNARIFVAPLPDAVVILEREPNWIHARVARRTDGVRPVL